MAIHCSPGDRVVCKIKDNKVVNVYENKCFDQKAFDIITEYNEGYLIYIPPTFYISNTITVTVENYKHYGVDKKFVGDEVLFITDHNILSIQSKVDGMICLSCMTFSPMAAANQPDGKFMCWNCSNYPFYK